MAIDGLSTIGVSTLHVRNALAHLQQPITSKHVETVHLTFTGHPLTGRHHSLDLDSMAQLRHLEIRDIRCSLLATQPIRLCSLIIPQSLSVSEHVTALRLVYNQISVASSMLPHLRYVTLQSFKLNDKESMLMLPRDRVDWDPSTTNRAASFHMLLNRYGDTNRCFASLKVIQELAFTWLQRNFDQGLFLRLLRESHRTISQFSWVDSSML